MHVERSHLSVLWSYKAIKEQIKILQDRLVRITDDYRELAVKLYSDSLFTKEEENMGLLQ